MREGRDPERADPGQKEQPPAPAGKGRTAEPKAPALGDRVIQQLQDLAHEVGEDARGAWFEARWWIPIASVVYFLAPAFAFASSFGGLAKLLPDNWPTFLSFLAGLLGVGVVWVRQLERTKGVSERLRSKAGRRLEADIRMAIATYESYIDAIRARCDYGSLIQDRCDGGSWRACGQSCSALPPQLDTPCPLRRHRRWPDHLLRDPRPRQHDSKN